MYCLPFIWKILNEGEGWESPREPYEVKARYRNVWSFWVEESLTLFHFVCWNIIWSYNAYLWCLLGYQLYPVMDKWSYLKKKNLISSRLENLRWLLSLWDIYSFLLSIHAYHLWWSFIISDNRFQLGRCLKVLKSELEQWLGKRRQWYMFASSTWLNPLWCI